METNLEINKQVPFSSGWMWIRQSFEVFKVIPIQALVLSLITGLLMLVPLINAVMQPFLTFRFAEMVHQVTKGNDYKFSDMFRGLFNNRTLVKLAMINLLLVAVITTLNFIASYYSLDILNVIVVILYLLLGIFMWLAPLVCGFNPGIEPKAAMLLSFRASIYNVITLLLFSILVFGFTVLAILPIFLGLLVWYPMVNLSTYFVYKSIFNTHL